MAGPEDVSDLVDLDGPEEDQDFWEDDELTVAELTRWYDAVHGAEQAGRACVDLGPVPGPEGPGERAEGSVPDLIAAVLAVAGDPALMSDAELVEALAGWHAIAARATGRELRMTGELLRRRKPRVWDRRADAAESARENLDGTAGAAGPGTAGPEPGIPERVMPAVVASREAAAEIALALTATGYAAQAQAQLTADLSRRLPAAFGELDAGRADLSRIRVLAEGTRYLSDADAGTVDALLAGRLGQWTTGELRDRVRRAVIRADPAAADRRADRAARKARFVLYGNDDQTATAAVERIPACLGAAVKARVNAIARAARAAGMTGPLPLLEAKVATGLLLDTLPDIPPPRDGAPPGGAPDGAGGPGPAPGPWDDGWPPGWFPGPPGPPAPAATDDPAATETGGAAETPPSMTAAGKTLARETRALRTSPGRTPPGKRVWRTSPRQTPAPGQWSW
jgi:hypothetical protein